MTKEQQRMHDILVLAGRRVLELEAIMQLEGAGIGIDRGEDLQSELVESANAALLLWADVHREVGLIARASGPGDLRLALAAIDPRSLAGGLEQLVLAAADLADRLMDPPEEVIG